MTKENDEAMGKALTKSQAEQVWQVLVEECGASAHPLDKQSFVHEYTTDSQYSPGSEWRFQGSLGFGGKFRYPTFSVDCYPEDATATRRAAIEAANAKLAALKVGFEL